MSFKRSKDVCSRTARALGIQAQGLVLVCLSGILAWVLMLAAPTPAAAAQDVARPSTAGQLQVSGVYLTDARGEHVVLRGVSTHGLQWFPAYVNGELFGQLAEEWNCNLIRLALYSEDYSKGNMVENLRVLHRGIEACLEHDMYVLVDWHILDDNDPNQNIEHAKQFFDLVSKEYADVPNVLYEICNEPNGDTSWSDITTYANQVIPIIRNNSPHAVVIVGTPNFDRNLVGAARHPLAFDNVMYTLHFYAATHHQDLRDELIDAHEAGLPVFVTECGLSEASGDGTVDFGSAVEWFDLLAQNDVSFAVWSLSNKAESSAFIKFTSDATTHLDDWDLTPIGTWCRALIQGASPAQIPVPAVDERGYLVDHSPRWQTTLSSRDMRSIHSWPTIALGVLALMLMGIVGALVRRRVRTKRIRTYDDLIAATSDGSDRRRLTARMVVANVLIYASTLFSLIYLVWRMLFSVPITYGWLAVAGNLVLLFVELSGFAESIVHYRGLAHLHAYPLPAISDDDYPDVDIFIATYNEPCDLLRRTINGCNHLHYPDKSKVHIWVCDDNRRPEMRALAEEMGVGYFDRPDNKGAKAGNLNHAMGLTSAPYVVTLDADMIVRSDFLLKTIPYFVDAERRAAMLPEGERAHLGLLQTPQAFYDPDVFQHALYAEYHTPNEQDYFYRTIEVAKASDNSVIYGGSNTVLARAALDRVGGFYTESITEDFATGLLIESSGFLSLALPEPLASGRTPHTFKEHIQQRTRWGRGVIVTGRKLHIFTRPGLTLEQRISYWSSVAYWYSPLKNLVYLLSPLLFAVFGLPVLECSWLDLIIFWMPMFALQTLCLRVVSNNALSYRWSGIHETSVMASLLIPIIKESLGISLSAFKVTNKTAVQGKRTVDWHSMAPYLVLLALSAVGIIRVVWLLTFTGAVGLFVLLFWLARNTYYLLMTIFLIDGRDSDGEPVRVLGAEYLTVTRDNPDGSTSCYEGVATVLNEHSMRVYLDEGESLRLGDHVRVHLDTDEYQADMSGAIVGLTRARNGNASVHTIEILDYGTSELEYLQILYDRVPSLPQALAYDFGALGHLWRNIIYHLEHTVR